MKPRCNINTRVHFFLGGSEVKVLSFPPCFMSVGGGARGELCGFVDMSWPTALWVSWAWGESVSSIWTTTHNINILSSVCKLIPLPWCDCSFRCGYCWTSGTFQSEKVHLFRCGPQTWTRQYHQCRVWWEVGNIPYNQWIKLFIYWLTHLLLYVFSCVNNSGIFSWSSLFWWTGKAVRFPGSMLCVNTWNKGDLQQEPLLHDEKHLHLYQHKPVTLSNGILCCACTTLATQM